MAAFTLREGVTFCRIGESNVFLDIIGDRYFCLQHRLNAAFTDLLDGKEVDPLAAESLGASGILVASRSSGLAACCSLQPAAGDWRQGGKASVLGVSKVVAARALWTWRVRNRSLAENIARLERRRSRTPARPPANTGNTGNTPGTRQLEQTIAAYECAAMFWSEHGRCLPTSMALFDDLAAEGHYPRLVFGVRLRPFHAHCWVELGGHLVTDTAERVHQFVPIRVI